MAKDNLFLGMARGSVGDVVFSRLNGVQVARARNRSPRNPQSPAQMVQRIVLATVGKAFSFMSQICDHSFEGFEVGQESQRKFMEVNVGILRDRLAAVLAYPVEEVVKASEEFNFSFKNDYLPVLNRYMLSAGSLPSIQLLQTPSGTVTSEGVYWLIPFALGESTPATMTYQEVVNALGLQRGDQLTFIQALHDGRLTGHDADLLTGFRVARIILEPESGDMSTVFISGSNNVGDPNERNTGSFKVLAIADGTGQLAASGLRFELADTSTEPTSDKHIVASAVILSRQIGGKWARSQAFLEPRFASGPNASQSSWLGLAYETYRLSAASDLYLNQAK